MFLRKRNRAEVDLDLYCQTGVQEGLRRRIKAMLNGVTSAHLIISKVDGKRGRETLRHQGETRIDE